MQSITIDQGNGQIDVAVQALGGGVTDGSFISLTPNIGGATGLEIIGWTCGAGNTSVPPKFRPGSCQG